MFHGLGASMECAFVCYSGQQGPQSTHHKTEDEALVLKLPPGFFRLDIMLLK